MEKQGEKCVLVLLADCVHKLARSWCAEATGWLPSGYGLEKIEKVSVHRKCEGGDVPQRSRGGGHADCRCYGLRRRWLAV
jgi:hypothetical protein